MPDFSNFEKAIESISERVQRHAEAMPIAAFTTSPLWIEARWSATTFRWHPKSEAPPLMGLVFDNADAGLQLFKMLEKAYNHQDRFEEMRVSIIEGSPPDHPYGYSVHICPEPDALAMHATSENLVLESNLTPFLGRWNRMYPAPGSAPLLPRFKEEFKKHGEYLLAPVTRRVDGHSHFTSELGFIKHTIEFRNITEVVDRGDIDVGAIGLPLLVPPRPVQDSAR
jgi:hypothetical protein